MSNVKNTLMLALGALLLGVLSVQSYSLIQTTQQASSLSAPGIEVPLMGSRGNVPTVITLPAIDVASTSVTLNSSINPNGQQVFGWFMYGTSTSTMIQTNKKIVTTSMSPVQFSAVVSNFSPNKNYLFEVCAQPIALGDVACSSPLEFKTLAN